jgi:hypothetical protein
MSIKIIQDKSTDFKTIFLRSVGDAGNPANNRAGAYPPEVQCVPSRSGARASPAFLPT